MIEVQSASSQGIANPNPTVYPAATLLSPKRIEDSNGEFYLYDKGMISAVVRTSKSLDYQWLSIPKASSFEFHPWDNLESKNCSIGETEVVPYGMVLLSTLGDLIGVATSTHDAVIQLAFVINRTDYWKAGRGMEQLGLSKLDKKGLKKFLLEGRK